MGGFKRGEKGEEGGYGQARVVALSIDWIELGISLFGYDEGWPRLRDSDLICWKEFPDRHLLLCLEQMGGPVWSVTTRYGGDSTMRMSHSGIPPISEALADDIDKWFDDYLEWISDEFINPKMDPDFPFDAFNARGEALAHKARNELGHDWRVEFDPAAPR